ncbi:hypothetical protein R1flu_013825 [Riccia fluitans]|uniref:Disease resistance R13L4/SHOC-2-like LRR domain-containing protein n=1 Tax=Riccia fluitans TaxID=41844 RepID=A0ABD1YHU9_9MARC
MLLHVGTSAVRCLGKAISTSEADALYSESSVRSQYQLPQDAEFEIPSSFRFGYLRGFEAGAARKLGHFREQNTHRVLFISTNRVEMHINAFGSLESLKKLMLKCASLERLPDSICSLRELHMMELSDCRNLEELPIDIGCLENIQSLIIENDSGSRGRLKELPASIGDLERLEMLTVYSTRLQGLPSRLGDLRALKTLVVRSEALEDIPTSLSRLQSLENLRLEGKLVRENGETAAEFLSDGFTHLTNLQTLVLISQRLERLPDNLANLKKLQRLDLQCPEVFTLPDSWEALPELRRMKLSCLSKSLTGRWGGMAALQKLKVSLCRELTSFPDSLGELKALHTLQISFCDELRSLPVSVGRLEMLQKLTVEHCAKLESLPESLGQLTSL